MPDPSYLREVLLVLKAAGIHAAIETCGHFDCDAFETHLARYVDLVDLVYYDLNDVILARLSTDEQQRLIRFFERRFGERSSAMPDEAAEYRI